MQGLLVLKMSLSQTLSRRHPLESLQAKVDVHQLHIHKSSPSCVAAALVC